MSNEQTWSLNPGVKGKCCVFGISLPQAASLIPLMTVFRSCQFTEGHGFSCSGLNHKLHLILTKMLKQTQLSLRSRSCLYIISDSRSPVSAAVVVFCLCAHLIMVGWKVKRPNKEHIPVFTVRFSCVECITSLSHLTFVNFASPELCGGKNGWLTRAQHSRLVVG